MKFLKHAKTIFTALAASLLLITQVWAADLDSAKNNGYLGEQLNGYLGLVDPNAPHDVQTLMDDINQKRRQHYKKLAAKEGIDLAAVEKLAGETAVEKTSKGNYVQDVSGNWVKK